MSKGGLVSLDTNDLQFHVKSKQVIDYLELERNQWLFVIFNDALRLCMANLVSYCESSLGLVYSVSYCESSLGLGQSMTVQSEKAQRSPGRDLNEKYETEHSKTPILVAQNHNVCPFKKKIFFFFNIFVIFNFYFRSSRELVYQLTVSSLSLSLSLSLSNI